MPMAFGKKYSSGGGMGRKRSGARGKPATMQDSMQPGGGMGGMSKGSFGKGGGKGKMAGGVMYDGMAGATTKNGGNYNEVMSKAKKFA